MEERNVEIQWKIWRIIEKRRKKETKCKRQQRTRKVAEKGNRCPEYSPKAEKTSHHLLPIQSRKTKRIECIIT